MLSIKKFLKEHNIAPTKLRGQNFLVSEFILKKIIDAAELSPEDNVLEIGPGLGILTRALAARAKQVLAIEKDFRLARILRAEFKDMKNVKIIEGDILNFSNKEILNLFDQSFPATNGITASYKIVANIPYNITSDILIKFLSEEPRPSMLVLMTQKEVAERIMEKDGKSSRLSIFTHYFGDPQIAVRVPRTSFYPSPKVDSAIIKIIVRKPKYSQNFKKQANFLEFVRLGFTHPRKKLISNLSKKFNKERLSALCSQFGFEQGVRAEDLKLEDWFAWFEPLGEQDSS